MQFISVMFTFRRGFLLRLVQRIYLISLIEINKSKTRRNSKTVSKKSGFLGGDKYQASFYGPSALVFSSAFPVCALALFSPSYAHSRCLSSNTLPLDERGKGCYFCVLTVVFMDQLNALHCNSTLLIHYYYYLQIS